MKRAMAGYGLVLAALIAVWAIDLLLIPWTDPYITDIVTRVGFNLLATMGLALVLGFTGQFSLGQAGFLAVGAYTSALMAMQLGTPFVVNVVAGGLVAGLAGLLVGLPSLRLVGDYLAVVTLGFNGIIIVGINNLPVLGGAQGLTGVPTGTTFGWTFTFVLLCAVFMRNLLHSPQGRVFAAVRDNEIATRSLGVDTTRAKVIAFMVGAFWTGIAGGLIAHYRSSIFPSQFEPVRSIELVAMVVLGGLGSLSGPVLAAAILTALPELLRPVAEYRMVLYSLLLVVMMILRPSGLLGSREIGDVLAGLWRRVRPVKEVA